MPTNIVEIHQKLFKVLQVWSDKVRSENFINPFFYMRNKRDDRFINGYWFPGNENYLCISFWSGGDSFNKTPNVFLEVNKHGDCKVVVTARDSIEKHNYFVNMCDFINKTTDRYKYIINDEGCVKIYPRAALNPEERLKDFINSDKVLIDNYLFKNGMPKVDEFTSDFNFISEKKFDSMYKQVLEEKVKFDRKNKINSLLNFMDGNTNQLPIFLRQFSIENYSGIKKAEIIDLPSNAKWIFITGENGFGKTSLLQAIALGLTNFDENKIYHSSKAKISAAFYKDGDPHINYSSLVDEKANFSPLNDYLVGYGPIRLNVQSEDSENTKGVNSSNIYNLFRTDGLLKNINYQLKDSKNYNPQLYSLLVESLKKATAGIIKDIVVTNEGEVLFYDSISKVDGYQLNNLASGLRSIINLVGDLIIRLHQEQKVSATKYFRGIIIIDELENHLHPKLQKEFPKCLSEIFPNLQFIVSTHSPIPFLGAPQNSVFLKVDKDNEMGISVKNLDIDISVLLPNAILASPIFGFESLIPESHDKNDFIRVEDSYKEILENDKMNEDISKYLSDENTKKLLDLIKKNK